jgi:hypothetical protein
VKSDGDRRQDDVVHRGAVPVGGLVDLVEVDANAGEAPVTPRGPVERRAREPPADRRSQLRGADPEATHRRRYPRGAAQAVHRRVDGEPAPRGHTAGERGVGGHGCTVDQAGQYGQTTDPVGQDVVQDHDQC